MASKSYKDGYIGYAGQIDGRSGYGRSGLSAIRNLIKSGLHVTHFGGEYGPRSHLYPRWEDIDDETASVIKRKDRADVEHILVHTIPDSLEHVSPPKKIVWTMWETDRIPKDNRIKFYSHWDRLINEKSVGLIVPATQQADIFRDSGIEAPMEIVHVAIQTEEFPYVPRSFPNSRPFTFFSWSAMDIRKCPIETVNCFLSAFGPNNPNVRLVMKTSNHEFGMGSFGIPRFDFSNVSIIDESWDQPRLQKFLATEVDACVFLSHGEGFYVPPLEALASGLPTVVSNHTGSSDYADERYLFPVRTRGLEPCPWGEDARWWTPDYDHAIERLRQVYGDYESALRKSHAGSAWVSERWSAEHQRHDLIRALDKLAV